MRIRAGILLGVRGALFQVDGFLIIGARRLQALLLLGGIGLLGGRHAVSVAEFEPDQVAGLSVWLASVRVAIAVS